MCAQDCIYVWVSAENPRNSPHSGMSTTTTPAFVYAALPVSRAVFTAINSRDLSCIGECATTSSIMGSPFRPHRGLTAAPSSWGT